MSFRKGRNFAEDAPDDFFRGAILTGSQKLFQSFLSQKFALEILRLGNSIRIRDQHIVNFEANRRGGIFSMLQSTHRRAFRFQWNYLASSIPPAEHHRRVVPPLPHIPKTGRGLVLLLEKERQEKPPGRLRTQPAKFAY